MNWKEVRKRIPTLWRHYSSWVLAAIAAVAGAREYGLEVSEYLPRSVLVILAFAGLVVKVIPQKPVE